MKGKTIVKWLGNGITILFIFLLAVTMLFIIASRAAGEEPSLFGYQFKTVLSGSMDPEMPVGSMILIQLADEKETFRTGDVITFKTKDDMLVTHRIIETEDNGQRFVTKGDNNNGPDIDPVLVENIVGKYVGWTIPYLGYVFHYLSSKQGILLVFLIPGVLLLGHAVFTLIRMVRLIEVQANERK